MFNQYPDQTSDRKGFAIFGLLIFLFGCTMAFFESWLVACWFIFCGIFMLLMTAFFGYAAFKKQCVFSKLLLTSNLLFAADAQGAG